MPNNAVARVNFATTIEKAGHPTLALTHFEQVLSLSLALSLAAVCVPARAPVCVRVCMYPSHRPCLALAHCHISGRSSTPPTSTHPPRLLPATGTPSAHHRLLPPPVTSPYKAQEVLIRYGVLEIAEATVMCTAKDRSAERHSDQCAAGVALPSISLPLSLSLCVCPSLTQPTHAEKAARLEKGVAVLQLLLHDADETQARQASKLMTAEHRRLLAQALVLLGRRAEAQAEYEGLRSLAGQSDASGAPVLAGYEAALYTFEYAQLLEEQGQSGKAEGIYEEALAMKDPQVCVSLFLSL